MSIEQAATERMRAFFAAQRAAEEAEAPLQRGDVVTVTRRSQVTGRPYDVTYRVVESSPGYLGAEPGQAIEAVVVGAPGHFVKMAFITAAERAAARAAGTAAPAGAA